MMIPQTRSFGRAALLSPYGIESNAWGQRAQRGEIALAFGLSRPVFPNTYGEIDLIALELTMILADHANFDLGRASAIVRRFWREWLEGVAWAERSKPKGYSDSICLVIAANDDKTRVEVEVGFCEQVAHKLSKADGSLVAFPIPLDVVLHRARESAAEVGLTLPEHFCPGPPDSAAFKKWLAHIEEYRRFARKKDAAKGRAMATAE